jgi:hypothetical protein
MGFFYVRIGEWEARSGGIYRLCDRGGMVDGEDDDGD